LSQNSVPVAPSTSAWLITHGVAKYLLSCFSEGSETFERHDTVIVRTRRGLELGTVLGLAETGITTKQGRLGKIIRRANLDDQSLFENQGSLAERVREQAQNYVDAKGLPLVFLESELLLEGEECILHTLVWGTCSIDGILQQLQEHFGITVRILDISTQPKEESGGCETCGSESGGCSSCGTESKGGCSTGSCSKGKVKSAEELTGYFRNLSDQLSHRVALPTTE